MWPWDIYILFAYLFFCYYWSQCIIFNLYSASQSNQNHYISCLVDPLWLTKNASESFSFTRYVSGAVSDSAHLSFHSHARQIPAPGINDGICSFTLCHWYFVMSRWCLLISKLIVLYSELSLRNHFVINIFHKFHSKNMTWTHTGYALIQGVSLWIIPLAYSSFPYKQRFSSFFTEKYYLILFRGK